MGNVLEINNSSTNIFNFLHYFLKRHIYGDSGVRHTFQYFQNNLTRYPSFEFETGQHIDPHRTRIYSPRRVEASRRNLAYLAA